MASLGKLFRNAKGGPGIVKAQDSQEQDKRQRLRDRNRVQIQGNVNRSSKNLVSKTIWNQLQHNQQQPIHPLWNYLPEHQRSTRQLSAIRRRRLWAWFKQRRQRITTVLVGYVVIWTVPLLLGEPLITVFALLPLLLVPPVGYLVYRLVWMEFNA
jgi:hypothetical protein